MRQHRSQYFDIRLVLVILTDRAKVLATGR
jgi:hypothetical protein